MSVEDLAMGRALGEQDAVLVVHVQNDFCSGGALAVPSGEEVVAEINRIWMDRENLTPLHTARKRLVAMELYQLLPQTNCKLCGQTTCFAFASKITVGEAKVEACTPLFDEVQYAGKRKALLDILALAAV